MFRERPRDSPYDTKLLRSCWRRLQSEIEFIWRYSLISSANMRSLAWRRTEGAELTKRAKRRGKRTAPWGTPEEGTKAAEDEPRTETKRWRLERYELSQESKGLPMPSWFKVFMRILWSTRLNALEKSI